MSRIITISMVVLILGLIAQSSVFTVDETQFAIVTTFGDPKRIITKPGLQWKLPAPAQTVLFFDNRLQVFDPRPNENFTLDRKNLVVDTYACWRVVEPKLFLQKVGTTYGAEKSLEMLVASEMGAELGKHELSDLVSTEADDLQLEAIMTEVTRRCHDKALSDYGIDVRDVRIKRLNLPDENKDSVYERMRAEREQKAKEYRATGEEQAMAIRAKTELEKRQILSEAYKEAQRIKGEGDAEAVRIYQAAYSKNPAFYKFMRTLGSYKKILGDDTTVVMSSDSELLKLLTDFNPAELAVESAAVRPPQPPANEAPSDE